MLRAQQTARYNKLNENDKLVSVLMDEVYTHQDIQYINGNFFGAENGELTKTLCVMINSITGKYMVPIVSINAGKLYHMEKCGISDDCHWI